MSLRRFSQILPDKYHYLSAACFSIFNKPQAVSAIWSSAYKDLQADGNQLVTQFTESDDRRRNLRLARQFRESILRAGLFGGMSKAINELYEVMPENLREDQDSHTEEVDLMHKGSQFLSKVYGKQQGSNIEKALFKLYPRLGTYSVAYVYGGVYADTSVLSIRDACVLMYMCNMAVDTPKQAIGHIGSSRNQGVTTEELLNVGIMMRSIAELYQIKLENWESIMEYVESEKESDRNPYEV